MKKVTYVLLLFLSGCNGQNLDLVQNANDSISFEAERIDSKIDQYYREHLKKNVESVSHGSVSNGSMEFGSLFPFSGSNWSYFDTSSYLNGRAFSNSKVIQACLDTYDALFELRPDRKFVLMECSNEHGGKIAPHRTHQNGLSIDFMMPLIQNDVAYYDLDKLGATHYLLQFNADGKYISDTSISIDLNLVAQHIVLLNEKASLYDLKVSKVIINTNFKKDLFATEYGALLKKSGIYVVQHLDPLINSLHDDHFHIDFEAL